MLPGNGCPSRRRLSAACRIARSTNAVALLVEHSHPTIVPAYSDSGFRRPCSSGSYRAASTSVITKSDNARFDGARRAHAQ